MTVASTDAAGSTPRRAPASPKRQYGVALDGTERRKAYFNIGATGRAPIAFRERGGRVAPDAKDAS
jgi:hypothetical protein